MLSEGALKSHSQKAFRKFCEEVEGSKDGSKVVLLSKPRRNSAAENDRALYTRRP